MRFGECLDIKHLISSCCRDDMVSWELFAFVLTGSSDLMESCYHRMVAREPAETTLSLTNWLLAEM